MLGDSGLPSVHKPSGVTHSPELREPMGARRPHSLCAAARQSVEKKMCPTHSEGDCRGLYTKSLHMKWPLSKAQIIPSSLALGYARKWPCLIYSFPVSMS